MESAAPVPVSGGGVFQPPTSSVVPLDFGRLRALVSTYLRAEDVGRIEAAYHFSADAHQGQMRKSGELTEEGLFKKGETIDAEGEAFQIRIGNPGVIAITINGQEGRFPWNPAQPYTLELNMENFKEFLPR